MEFLEWREYIRLQATQHSKQDYYLAQIAQEVARVLVKNRNSVKMERFLLKFTTGEKALGEKTDVPISEEALAERIARSKAAWMGMTGLGKDGKIAYKVRKPPAQKPLVEKD